MTRQTSSTTATMSNDTYPATPMPTSLWLLRTFMLTIRTSGKARIDVSNLATAFFRSDSLYTATMCCFGVKGMSDGSAA